MADQTGMAIVPVALQQPLGLESQSLAKGVSIGTVSLIDSRHSAGTWAEFDPILAINTKTSDYLAGFSTVWVQRQSDDLKYFTKTQDISNSNSRLLKAGPGCVTAGVRIYVVTGSATALGQTPCLVLQP
ncbi:hypothetical protein [Streptomyces sp. HPF1205]|uniref:hypothetical protein n=1 Tax=Streptomyces sp. HPF1205 TaxID=2873262 RepID=UPI001CED5204|nr:hypothetical protein [Streptomyces sp. HPF1205]